MTGVPISYTLLAQDYVGLLDELNIEKVHLVGWSDGANIGYTISTGSPDRLASHFAHAGNVSLDGIDPTVESNEVFGVTWGRWLQIMVPFPPHRKGSKHFWVQLPPCGEPKNLAG